MSVVVSKKTAKLAVDRHLIKRRVYESVARYEKTSELPFGSYVFFAKKGAEEISFKVLYGEVSELLSHMSGSIVKAPKLV